MGKELRILILEDDAVDAQLIQQELRRSQLAHTSKVVAEERDFLASLEYFQPDIVLADYRLPGYDGMAALAAVRRKNPNLPFIFVSGVMGEELAVEALKCGATDYVVKDKLGRLAPAILRARREVQERIERQRNENIKEALYRISELSASITDMERFYPEVHQVIKTLIPVNNLYIALYHPSQNLLTFPYFQDEKDSPPRPRPLGQGLTDWVIRNGRGLLINLENRERLMAELELKAVGAPAVDWLGLPLASEGRVLGALVIQSYNPALRLGDAEQDIMAFVSQHIAVALERVRTREKLRESEMKHRLLLDSIRTPIISLGRDGRINYCNQAFADLWGSQAEALEGGSLESLPRDFLDSELAGILERSLKSDETFRLEQNLRGRSYSFWIYPTVWGILAIAEDISDRVLMEQHLQRAAAELEERVEQRTQELAEANRALSRSEEKYRFLYEESPTINIIIGINGLIQDVNRVALERFGYQKDEVVGKPVLKFVAYEQREEVMADLEKNFQGQSTPEMKVGVLARDGSVRTVLFSQKNVILYQEGQPQALLISGIDISERAQAEEMRLKYEFSVNASKDLMTLIRHDGVYEAANEAYCQAHRKKRQEIVGRTVEEVWGAEAARIIQEYLERCLRGEEVHYQKWLEFPALGRRFFDVAYYPYRDPRGRITHVAVVSRDLTDYKLAEDKIAEGQRAMATLLSNLPGMAYRGRDDDRRTMDFVSQGAADLTGYDPEMLVGEGAVSYMDLVYQQDREMLLAEIRNALSRQQPFQLIYRLRDAQGEEKWVWEQGRGVYGPEGTPMALEGFITDITDRKQAERALWEKEEQYRTMFENMPIGVYRTNPEGQILMANPALVKMLGYQSLDELKRVNLEQQNVYGPGYSRAYFKEKMEREGRVRALEYEWVRRDGSLIYIRENAIAVRDRAGRIVYYQGTVEDITEQRQARMLEAALYRISEVTGASRDLQEFYREVHGIIGQLMPARNFYIALADPATRTLSFPYFVDERDPRPQPRPMGDGITEHVIATGQPLLATKNTIQNMVAAGLIGYAGSQDSCWLGVPLKSEERTFGVLAVHSYQDHQLYTEKDRELLTFVSHQIAMAIKRKQAEEELGQLAAAIEQAAEGIAVFDLGGRICYCNPAFGEILGYSRQEAMALGQAQIMSQNFMALKAREINPLIDQGKPWQGLFTQTRRDGSEFMAEATVSPVLDLSGRASHVVMAIRDVTEQRRLRSIAEAVNTMENIGYVFSGIRHEIGNALTSLKMAIGILSKNLETYPRETIAKIIDMATKEVSRMEELLRSLKNFSMYESLKPERVALNQFLAKVRMLALEDFGRRGIAIETDFHPVEIEAWLDPRALQQVMLNLMANAADALQGRQEARIRLATRKEGGRLEIRVEDNGCGMSRDQLKNLFKPFYTSKPQGTGLGLVITKNIMIKMGGDIAIDSERGRGTTVVLQLPAAEPPEQG